MSSDKKVVGLVEEVKIIGSKGEVKTEALLDSGATRSSVDIKIAAKAGLGPITGSKKIKSASKPHAPQTRAIAEGKIVIKGVKKKVQFTLANRSTMSYPVLVGRDVLHSDFVIDVEKTHETHKVKDLKKKEKK